ncbi:MAG: EAL domain-containing protein [Ruminococcus sp.]|nr:EAL domain-containing protein [Ruminococcus sp.]
MPQEGRREKNIRRKVLVVDDEIINLRLLGFIVSRDYEVLYAEDGEMALELIRQHERTLSLILLDLLMPKMDGYQLLEIIKDDPTLKRIPVIVLTSEKSAEVRSLQLGACDFIAKPYDLPEVILARVHRSIELAEDNSIIGNAETDELTGLYTKPFFFEYCRRHDRYFHDIKMDAIVLNINRFHLINELEGRHYGDRLLRLIAEHITELIGDSSGLACRGDSDTFYIYSPHIESYERIIDEAERKLNASAGTSRVSIRVGIYQNVDMSLLIEQRFDRANIACSGQRMIYKTSYGYYDTELHEKELYNERLINEIDNALENGDFKVFYQPKYNIEGDKPRLSSAEALIRWFHPELGIISPGAFVPLFEGNGLIQKLDRYVWQQAAGQIKEWKDTYGRVIPVSVNVSRIDIYDPDLERVLLDIVRSNGLEPDEYLLEITESAYTDDSSQIVDKVSRLRAHGFRVEMDDFGSGYSSLNMLAALPIDALKLDMRFVKNIAHSGKDMKMVELMIEIAQFLGVPVIAEGVESQEQYELLKNAGCQIIQGYYFSKPIPPEEWGELIRREDK